MGDRLARHRCADGEVLGQQRRGCVEQRNAARGGGLDRDRDLSGERRHAGEQDERAARVVELRFFAGLPEPAVAEVLGVSERTVRNDWRMARAWLRCALDDAEDPDS